MKDLSARAFATKTLFVLLFLASAWLVFFANCALAQQRQEIGTKKAGIAVYPLSYDVQARPGDRFKKEIKITNVTNEGLLLAIEADDFIPEDEFGHIKILASREKGTSKAPLSPWVSLSEKIISLAPRQDTVIQYTVSVPKNAKPGGRYGVIRFYLTEGMFDTRAAEDVENSIWQTVYLRVIGKTEESVDVEELYTYENTDDDQNKASIFNSGPVGFGARIENTSTVHYTPSAFIRIKSFYGYRKDVPVKTSLVLPDSIREFRSVWDDTPVFGFFQADVLVRVGDKTLISPASSFLILPWKIILIVFAVLLVFGAALFMSRKVEKQRAS